MKVKVADTAVKTLKDILADSQDKPKNIRVYFAGSSCCGPSFGLALDEQNGDDLNYEVEGLNFIMSKEDYNNYGDIVIEDTGYGFTVAPENQPSGGGCGGGCSGCGN
ncbi:Fe-S cluster assembly protein HesB [Paraclostridium bifermentans]|uniref:Fe-S cluster assembly protein HesB n=1 Tax=Paraclostridium bifermentans TaxID=1490 RepID=A0ABY8R0D6_PARBF|nr:Fe-S cluster assembly protein HesB [Paraclostridium bifermentans]